VGGGRDVDSGGPGAKTYAERDPELSSHYVRIEPTGAKSHWAVARNPIGKQKWVKIGDVSTMPIAEARKRAGVAMQRIKDGLPAFEPPAETFGAVAADWLARYVIEEKRLRSAPEIRRFLDKLIVPKWRDREFTSIRRSDVTALLDAVQKKHGRQKRGPLLVDNPQAHQLVCDTA